MIVQTRTISSFSLCVRDGRVNNTRRTTFLAEKVIVYVVFDQPLMPFTLKLKCTQPFFIPSLSSQNNTEACPLVRSVLLLFETPYSKPFVSSSPFKLQKKHQECLSQSNTCT